MHATIVLGIPDSLLLKIASKMLEETYTEVDELPQDAAKEILNVMCGNICAKLSQRDLIVNLAPPKIASRTHATSLPDGYAVITSLIAVGGRFALGIFQHESA